jgi:hypothetical protein
MIAGRCCIGGACANTGVPLAGNKTARAAKHMVSGRIIDKEFIAGIFTHQQTPCKVGFLGKPFAYQRLTKIVATSQLGQCAFLYLRSVEVTVST